MAPHATLETLDGATIPLASLWADGPVLLLFLRHFACPSCSVRIDRWLPRVAELERLGVGFAIVGCGSHDALARFAERLGLDEPGLARRLDVSPDRAAYAAVGFGDSTWGTFGPRAALTAAGLYVAGRYLPRHADDGRITQQGGLVLVDRGGTVRHRHPERSLADARDPSDAIDAALRLAAEGAPL